jgi:hypothetical protein
MDSAIWAQRLVIGLRAGALCAVGCQGNSFTAAGPPQAPHPENCDFPILTSTPASGFVEIGTIDFDGLRRTAQGFKYRIQSDVCAAGGDAVVAMINGKGDYIKATVLKRIEANKVDQSGAQSESAGCHFDAQCKGERLCVRGECVDPPSR